MEFTPTLIDFCSQFHQDFGFRANVSFDDELKMLWDGMERSKRIDLVGELSRLLESPLTNKELSKAWAECGAQVYVPDGQMKDFLQMILENLKGSLS